MQIGRDLAGTHHASDDENQRRQVEESDPTDQRVDGGCTDQDESDYESRSPPRPSDDRNTADECRSDDDDCFGIVIWSTRATSTRLTPTAIQPAILTESIGVLCL